jgi:hypothetical protein
MRANILRRWKAVREPRAVDEAVDVCYGSRRFGTDLERLEFLSDPLTQLAEKETRNAKRRRSKQ